MQESVKVADVQKQIINIIKKEKQNARSHQEVRGAIT